MPMRRDTYQTLRDLFMARVAITDACWLWRGASTKGGYGRLQYMNRSLRAHRVAYELLVGRLEEDMNVCHTCDNPICVRPDHLFLGTTVDNLHDRDAKGRGFDGEHNPRAKLTTDDVLEVRRLYRLGGITQQELADRFGVKQITVSNIVSRKTWKRLPSDP